MRGNVQQDLDGTVGKTPWLRSLRVHRCDMTSGVESSVPISHWNRSGNPYRVSLLGCREQPKSGLFLMVRQTYYPRVVT